MSQEVKQWLAEIKALQQKVAEAHQERDQAYASATNWRTLYETEAKQRRLEATLARQALDRLKAELQSLRDPAGLPDYPDRISAIQAEVAQIEDLATLQMRLTQTLEDCDRLSQSLRTEQAAHANTRQNLTTALGDAIDQLNQERGEPRSADVIAVDFAARTVESARSPDLKNPSLEQPQTD